MRVWISWHVEHRHWLKKGWWAENNRERLKEPEKLTCRINFCGVLEDCVLV